MLALIKVEASLPITFTTWRDSAAYARWAGKRLSTEAEWEKAARGTDARIYPWGNEWDPTKARAGLEVDAGPTTVGSFPKGASPYGCLDMAGNVWEWTSERSGTASFGVVRGGAWDSGEGNVTVRSFLEQSPENTEPSIGFRCVRVALP